MGEQRNRSIYMGDEGVGRAGGGLGGVGGRVEGGGRGQEAQ